MEAKSGWVTPASCEPTAWSEPRWGASLTEKEPNVQMYKCENRADPKWSSSNRHQRGVLQPWCWCYPESSNLKYVRQSSLWFFRTSSPAHSGLLSDVIKLLLKMLSVKRLFKMQDWYFPNWSKLLLFINSFWPTRELLHNGVFKLLQAQSSAPGKTEVMLCQFIFKNTTCMLLIWKCIGILP